ncbi:MAG: hypothetical protein PHR14_08820 [Oscillospiraceae bacterium]|nr:hypothetical protein [Oscillospiraceae bacterium]
MKFYRNHGELITELFGENAQEYCKKCPYGYTDSDDNVSCMGGPVTVKIDDDTADSDCECYIP